MHKETSSTYAQVKDEYSELQQMNGKKNIEKKEEEKNQIYVCTQSWSTKKKCEANDGGIAKKKNKRKHTHTHIL